MDLDAAPITGLRSTGLRDPLTGERLIAVEVLVGESAADGLRLHQQVAVMMLTPAKDGDADGTAG